MTAVVYEDTVYKASKNGLDRYRVLHREQNPRQVIYIRGGKGDPLNNHICRGTMRYGAWYEDCFHSN